jgi:hypothetical protein
MAIKNPQQIEPPPLEHRQIQPLSTSPPFGLVQRCANGVPYQWLDVCTWESQGADIERI